MRLRSSFLIVLFIFALPQSGGASDPSDIASTLSGSGQAFDVRDRLAILNLLAVYSHAADGLHTELFGEAFTKDATFSIVVHGAESADPLQSTGGGRKGIVAALAERHAAFRKSGTQRRHFLTNPIVWNQTETSAEISVYLQLRSSVKGAPATLVATGRYQGRVRKTEGGWRISDWTFYGDQALD